MSNDALPAPAFPEPRLRRIDASRELAVAMALRTARTRPEAVTLVLAELLESLGGVPVDRATVRALPCGTREWLVQWLAARLGGGGAWFEVRCSGCGVLFDLSLDVTQPVCVAPETPAREVLVDTSLGPMRFSVPTGAQEEAFALRGGSDSRRAFAALCAVPPLADAGALSEADLDAVDAALEAASPDVADTVQTACPACGAQTGARIDPLRYAFPREEDVLERIHVLADGYRWPLPEILSLSSHHLGWFADRIAGDRRASRRGP